MTVEYKAWPYKEAQDILEKLQREQTEGKERKHDFVLLETGYGPSGLPHIGTFGEVARTDFVRQALETLAPDLKTRVYAFSDDMDGMRGIPLDMPNVDMLKEHLGKPLSHVPDPFGEHDSYAGHMNAKLCAFLDSFGFEYDFKSSRDQYEGGVFNQGLERIVEKYDEVLERCTRELREDAAATWSPFLPVCEHCGKINTTRVLEVHPEDHTVSYACDRSFTAKILTWEERERADRVAKADERPYYVEKVRVHGCGGEGRRSVRDGNMKVGWKVDWALRWFVLGVDYEMYGKDLIESAVVSADLVRILGGEPPVGLCYEWFNDEKGRSISKTKGNGITVDQWLHHGPIESLSWFIYQNPTKANNIGYPMIPRAMDPYLRDRGKYGELEPEERVNNTVHFVDEAKLAAGEAIEFETDITYGLILNLVGVLATDDVDMVRDYLKRYDETAGERYGALIDAMIESAMRYNAEFVAPNKVYAAPGPEFQGALDQFIAFLEGYEGSSAEEIQNAAYAAGKDHDVSLKKWFKAMYTLLLGQPQGPRIGSFVSLYGVGPTLEMLRERLT